MIVLLPFLSLYVISDECQFLVLIIFDIIFYNFYKDVTNVKDLGADRNPFVPVSRSSYFH